MTRVVTQKQFNGNFTSRHMSAPTQSHKRGRPLEHHIGNNPQHRLITAGAEEDSDELRPDSDYDSDVIVVGKDAAKLRRRQCAPRLHQLHCYSLIQAERYLNKLSWNGIPWQTTNRAYMRSKLPN
jgi:hypothetical protein